LRRLVLGEEAAMPWRGIVNMSGDEQGRECGLGFSIALRGGQFEPPPPLRSARWHAFALQVAQADPILGGRQFGLGGAGYQLEAAVYVAGIHRGFPFLEKPRCSAEV
jgi:hypothetical protein